MTRGLGPSPHVALYFFVLMVSSAGCLVCWINLERTTMRRQFVNTTTALVCCVYLSWDYIYLDHVPDRYISVSKRYSSTKHYYNPVRALL